MLTHSLNAHILKIQCIQHKYACTCAHTHNFFHCLLWHDVEMQNVVGPACKWMGKKLIMSLETDVSSELLLTSFIVTNPGLALTLHPGIRGTETERNCLSFSVVPQCFIPNSKLEVLFIFLLLLSTDCILLWFSIFDPVPKSNFLAATNTFCFEQIKHFVMPSFS